MTTPDVDDQADIGIRCPECRSRLVPVKETRQRLKNRIARRRQCVHCGHRFTTYERVESSSNRP